MAEAVERARKGEGPSLIECKTYRTRGHSRSDRNLYRSKEEIERMVEEASRYEAEDKAVLERIEARNGAEAYLYNVRNSTNDEKLRDKIPATDKESLEATVKAGLEWLDDHRDADVTTVKEKQKQLCRLEALKI